MLRSDVKRHHRYILLESRIHYRAGFGDPPKLTPHTLDDRGLATSDNDMLRYRRVRRPVYPLDRIDRPYFHRTSASAEIDLVIEHDDGARWAIEIKRSLSARVGRGFQLACTDPKPSHAFVVHAGDDRYPISQTPEASSARELAADLRARS